MSQYPYPPQKPQPPQGYPPPPPQGYGQQMGYAMPGAYGMPDALAPAKRASVMMFVLGSMMLLCGLCTGTMAAMPLEQIAAQRGQMPSLPPGMTMETVRKAFMLAAFVTLPLGLLEIIVGVFVRRGGAGAAVFGIVLASLMILYFAANVFFSVMQHAVGGVLLAAIIAGLFVLQLVFCVQSSRAASQIGQMQAAYQAQYWQYMQQQAYNTGGGGAAAYNPSAGGYNQGAYNAPPAPPPPQPPGASQGGWQWSAPPPPPPPLSPPPAAPPTDENSQQGGPHGQGPQ
jgi:hypothetical protein